MIKLTKLNNQALIVNAELIKFVESSPDTVLTLISGEKILVRETPEEVVAKVIAFRHDIAAWTREKWASVPTAGDQKVTDGESHG